VKFTPETREGLRDKTGYDAFLVLIDFLENTSRKEARNALRLLLWKFIELREQGNIELTRIQRLSLDQYGQLIRELLQIPSGGLLPVLLSVAMFQTLKECFHLDWEVEWQSINVADRASGVGGDVTIKSSGKTILSVEVTERSIDRNRVVSTFNTKIAAHGVEDYLFLFGDTAPEPEARAAAQQYFGQGHDISFLPVVSWLLNCLGTVGARCRKIFSEKALALLDQPTVPAHVKIAWNEKHTALLR
jgi:SacI restriction endonuclease